MREIEPEFHRIIPDGDEFERLQCKRCRFIHYENPKIIVGAVIEDSAGRIVMCRRAIEPQRGLWTIPAGFMELGESPDEGAAREAWEEARAKIEIRDLLAVYTIRHIDQVHMMYRAILVDDHIEPGPESLEVEKFDWRDIPQKELAFPSVHWSLAHYNQVRSVANFAPFGNPPQPYFSFR